MVRFKWFALAAAVLLMAAFTAPRASAQVSIGVNIGAQPVCPYGYFDYPPYNCAPYGYYGPEWFSGGIFIGAGPWFHGPENFHGHVNNRYDPRHGYKGHLPARGEHPDRAHPVGHAEHFQGNEQRDGRGHEAQVTRGNAGNHGYSGSHGNTSDHGNASHGNTSDHGNADHDNHSH